MNHYIRVGDLLAYLAYLATALTLTDVQSVISRIVKDLISVEE